MSLQLYAKTFEGKIFEVKDISMSQVYDEQGNRYRFRDIESFKAHPNVKENNNCSKKEKTS